MTAATISPITLEYPLRCTAEQAFATYADRIGEWWDARYTANADNAAVRSKFWGVLLDRFARLAEADA